VDSLLSPSEVFARYDAVFEGRVLPSDSAASSLPAPSSSSYRDRLAALERQVDALTSAREFRFDVLATWKGPPEPVVHTQQRTACGYPFEEGRVYLVYASLGTDGALWASVCGRTRPIEQAHDDLAALAARRSGPAPARGCAGCAVPSPERSAPPFLGLIGLAVVLVRRLVRD
jgi:MYXO-CTERM domain-containing protein